MLYEMIQHYIDHLTPEQLQSLAGSKGISLTEEEIKKLIHLIHTEDVDFSDQASVYAFIDKVEKATSKEHATLLYDLYAQYKHYL